MEKYLQGLFLEYKDPLFGIIIFVSIIFVVTLLTYLWNLYTLRFKHNHIEAYVKSFQGSTRPQTVDVLLSFKELPAEALQLLAHNYYLSSEYDTCIEICIDILKRPKHNIEKEILLLLSQAYYKAGFYKRSETALVELLRFNTREPKALNYLTVIYERLHRFSDAIDTLEALREMGEEVSLSLDYIRSLQLIKMALPTQCEELLALVTHNKGLTRPVFMYLFRNHSKFAWQNFDFNDYEEILDILWNLPQANLDFDIITQHKNLQALWYAKGQYETGANSDLFEINVLNTLLSQGHTNATLAFSYQCSNCMESTPLMSHRCPSCLELLSLQTQISVVQAPKDLSYYSF